nr:MAG TPA: hypothetical protein [Caudoviricetes sp.]
MYRPLLDYSRFITNGESLQVRAWNINPWQHCQFNSQLHL